MSNVKVSNLFKQMGDQINDGAKEGFETVATDIQQTTSDASPHKTGHLEKNHLNINYGSNSWEAKIYFVAYNGNFDYAKWTHDATYNLGPGSRAKKGANSKFAGSVPVGNKYATRTVDQGRDAYQQHIIDSIMNGLS